MISQKARKLSTSEVRILSLASIGGALEFYDFVIFVFFVIHKCTLLQAPSKADTPCRNLPALDAAAMPPVLFSFIAPRFSSEDGQYAVRLWNSLAESAPASPPQPVRI